VRLFTTRAPSPAPHPAGDGRSVGDELDQLIDRVNIDAIATLSTVLDVEAALKQVKDVTGPPRAPGHENLTGRGTRHVLAYLDDTTAEPMGEDADPVAWQASPGPARLLTKDGQPPGTAPWRGGEPTPVGPVSLARLARALDLLEIRYLVDREGSLLALWERHALLITLEGPDDEILVMRARPHATVPTEWASRALAVVNEWNHSRRFCKAYVGDPTDRGVLPLYAEIQLRLISGVHDALIVELIDCAAAVAAASVDWLHDEGSLL
jgi:hypothetical protein